MPAARTVLLALLTAVAVTVPAGVAHAAAVAFHGETLVVTGGPEASRLTLTEEWDQPWRTATYTVEDEHLRLLPGEGCEYEGGERRVHCVRPGQEVARRIRIDAAGGDDYVMLRPNVRVPAVITGGEGADQLFGGADADRVDGGPGPDVLGGDDGHGFFGQSELQPDDIVGGPDRDRVVYDKHADDTPIHVSLDDLPNDGWKAEVEGDNVHSDVEDVQGDNAPMVITGSAGPNLLIGGAAGDVIDGGGGEDELAGGYGADDLRARDGERDVVRCEGDADRATVDAGDVRGPDCETVEATAALTSVPPLHGTFPVSLDQRSARPARNRRFALSVRCGELAGCTGSVDVRTVKKVRVGRRWQSFALGIRSFSVPGGQTARLTYRLTTRQMAALRRVRTVPLLVHAVEVRPNQRDWTGSLTLRRRR